MEPFEDNLMLRMIKRKRGVVSKIANKLKPISKIRFPTRIARCFLDYNTIT